ncbi:MAG: BMC domain-containing protein [Bacteriovoracia bacterium]
MAATIKPTLARQWIKGLATHEIPALGFVELNSISRGLFLTDVALKKAPVRVIASQPISSGKHCLLFFGDVASVEESYKAVQESGDGCILRNVFIPSVHEDLVPFLDSIWTDDGHTDQTQVDDSIGIVESHTLAAAILSADRALKTAKVSLCRFRLGQGIGGKAYYVLTGKQEEVEAGLEAAATTLKELESFTRVDFIARPQEEALVHF